MKMDMYKKFGVPRVPKVLKVEGAILITLGTPNSRHFKLLTLSTPNFLLYSKLFKN